MEIGCSLSQSALDAGISCAWIGPRNPRMARLAPNAVIAEYCAGAIHFMGGLAKDSVEASNFDNTPNGLGVEQGLLLTPHFLGILDFGFDQHRACGSAVSAIYGDVIADRWDVYAFGTFPLD